MENGEGAAHEARGSRGWPIRNLCTKVVALAACALLAFGVMVPCALAEDGQTPEDASPGTAEAGANSDPMDEAGNEPPAPDEESPRRRIFVLEAPYLTWNDIGAETTPNLDAVLDRSGLCNLITRSTARVRGQAISPNEAAASLAAGALLPDPPGLISAATRLSGAVGSPGSESAPESAGDPALVEPTLADDEICTERVTYDGDKVLPGAMAGAFEAAGWEVAAIGCSDLGTKPVRPAAALAADPSGIVPVANTRPGYLLVNDPEAPYAVRTDMDALSSSLAQAIEATGPHLLVALDSGDLYRAGTYYLSNIEENSDSLHGSEIWQRALLSFDQTVGMALDNMAEGDVLIVYGTLSGASGRTRQDDAYAPLIVYGADYKGMLYSPSMRHGGLMSIFDLGATIYSLARIDHAVPDGASATVVPDTSEAPASDIIRQLKREASFAGALDEAQYPMNVVMFALMGITFLCSIVMLSPRLRLPARVLKVLLPATRVLWVAASAYPIATYLIVPFGWSGITAIGTIFLCLVVTAVLSVCALVLGACTRWVYSIMALMLLTVAVLTIDQLTGGHLASIGFLSYQPIRMSRFTGIGNEGAAVLFGAWLMLSGLLLNRFPDLGISKAFRTWLFPVMSAFIILVIVAPWWGSNFGVLVWGTVGAFSAWWMFRGNRLNWKVIGLTVLACVGLTVLLILADGLIGDHSHLGAMADSLVSQGLAYAPTIVSNIIALSVATLSYSPFVTVVMICLWAYLAWLRISKPGPYAVFWERNRYFKASFTASMVIAVIVILIEDSGILLPALIMVYAMAGLTWLVCDLHRWELRALDDPALEPSEAPVGGFKLRAPKPEAAEPPKTNETGDKAEK